MYGSYGIAFVSHSEFSLPDGSVGKSAVIFEVDMSSSVNIDNKKKDIFILGIGPTQGLDDTTLSAEAQYSINFLRSNKNSCLILHYNGSNSFLFVNATKTFQFKAKDSEIKKVPLVFRKYFRMFCSDNKKKTKLNECLYDFSVDYKTFGISYIIDIHKCLMKKHDTR